MRWCSLPRTPMPSGPCCDAPMYKHYTEKHNKHSVSMHACFPSATAWAEGRLLRLRRQRGASPLPRPFLVCEHTAGLQGCLTSAFSPPFRDRRRSA
jgi:hypothetical protein